MTALRRDGQHQSGFALWVRSVRELDSRNSGVCCQDIDWIWHKFRDDEIRHGLPVNHLMIFEEKSHGAIPTIAQRDSMMLIDQAFKQIGITAKFVNVRNQQVCMNFWGCFVLRYSGSSPEKSEWIEWNGMRITLNQLISILRFDVRPDDLKICTQARQAG